MLGQNEFSFVDFGKWEKFKRPTNLLEEICIGTSKYIALKKLYKL